MINSAINSRLNKLEEKQRGGHGSDTIIYLSSGRWLVLRNNTDYQTLSQAINFTHSISIKVDDSRLIISKMNEAEVKQLTKADQLQQNSPIFSKLKQPSKELAQMMLQYPEIQFHQVITTQEQE